MANILRQSLFRWLLGQDGASDVICAALLGDPYKGKTHRLTCKAPIFDEEVT